MARCPFLAPEVLQISTMDCGVAALTTFVSGYGVDVSYERLRQACQTSVDGTSIDALEDVANELGVISCQHLVPTDLFARSLDGRLPAVLIVSEMGQPPHFVVLWRRIGSWLHVMDPATGRVWIREAELRRRLLINHHPLSEDDFRDWFAASSYRAMLERLCDETLTGLRAAHARSVLASPDSAATLGAVDAALRLTAKLKPRVRMQSSLDEGYERFFRLAHTDPESVPAALRGLTPTADGGLLVTAAVALAPEQLDHPMTSQVTGPGGAELLASPGERSARALLQRISELLGQDGRALTVACVVGTAAIALASAVEVIVFRALWDAPRVLTTFGLRVDGVLVLGSMLLLMGLLQAALTWASKALGRLLELRMRTLTLTLLPVAPDDFVRTRPISDLAYRAHALSLGGQLPVSVMTGVRALFDVLVSMAALSILDPVNAAIVGLWVFAIGGTMVFADRRLGEIDNRFHAHGARLLGLFLDALRGFRPLRLHGYQNAFRTEQDRELANWKQTGEKQVETLASLDALSALLGVLLPAVIFLAFTERRGDPRLFVILAFWTFRIPSATQRLFSTLFALPAQRRSLERILEIANAVRPDRWSTATDSTADRAEATATGVSIELEGVSVVANGHTILADVDLHIPAAQHVAIVGPSGAGKSSLAGLLLGLHTPGTGAVRVDGRSLSADELEALRAQIAWVDAAGQLWNDTLFSNLEYAARGRRRRDLLETLETSDVLSVLDGMDLGLNTPVGSEGRLLSGGEGQRVRLGRALLPATARLAVLDEPFRGLDRATRRRLAFRSRLVWKQATMLFISHDISHALDFDRVLVVDGGRIVEDGHPLELAGLEGSRFAALLRAEEDVLHRTWSPTKWRRIRVEDGTVRDVSA
jgi:ATP-binding cassette subfamily B protein